eukprot:scaffold227736_cov14-Tisochrysis_lutea.AAC.1
MHCSGPAMVQEYAGGHYVATLPRTRWSSCQGHCRDLVQGPRRGVPAKLRQHALGPEYQRNVSCAPEESCFLID